MSYLRRDMSPVCLYVRIAARFLVLLCFLHLNNARSITKKSGMPADWRDLLGDDVLAFYSKKVQQHQNDSLFEGDIMGVDTNIDRQSISVNLGKNARQDEDGLWPNGIVPYSIKSGFSAMEQSMIMRALQDIMDKTCVNFVKKTSETDFIRFVKAGDNQGLQDVSLHVGCLDEIGQVQHEVMHALGFYHEQNREDRDEFVQIIRENILPDEWDQFTKREGDDSNLPYDYHSIMHYEWNAFAINEQLPTILPLSQKKKLSIGQRSVMSSIDEERINILYKCEEKKTRSASSRRRNNNKKTIETERETDRDHGSELKTDGI